jgi:hypothetical protein
MPLLHAKVLSHIFRIKLHFPTYSHFQLLHLQVAISIKPLKVRNWILPEMPGLITDFVLSLDDRYLYLVNWLHGDIRQYNIEDPAKPVLAGQVWVGGLLQKGSDVVYVTDDDKEEQYSVPQVKVIPPLKILLSLCIVKSRIYMGPILCK